MRDRFADAGLETAAQDADILIEHVTGLGPIDRVARPDTGVSAEAAAALEDTVRRRLAGEPVFRIKGARPFYGLDLALSPDTLEPRPDTEILVDAVIASAKQCVTETGGCRLLDLGTGTGAIALAVLVHVETCEAIATDISADALDTARQNAQRAGVADRFDARLSNWFDAVDGRFDIIVSNPPYIPTRGIGELAHEVRLHDPHRALDGGADGLDAYRSIVASARDHLRPAGRIAVEIGFDQKDAVRVLFTKAGYELKQATRDLAGNDRVMVFSKPAS